MARQRSSPMNKHTPPKTKPYAHTVHSGPKKVRAVLKSAREKPFLYNYKQNPLARKRAPRLSFETDQTLFEATEGYSDDDSTPNDAESSEGEDWEDGNTLISKFMEVDPAQVLAPKNTDDAKINLVESLQVPFGRNNGSLKQDLMDVLVPTLDRIKRAHDEITDAKGPDRRIEEGAQKFLQYTPEFTRKVEKSQAEYEQAGAKCEETTVDLIKKLKQAYEKQRQSRIDFDATLRTEVNKMMEGLASHDKEMARLEVTFTKRLKALAKLDSEKSLQNFLSML